MEEAKAQVAAAIRKTSLFDRLPMEILVLISYHLLRDSPRWFRVTDTRIRIPRAGLSSSELLEIGQSASQIVKGDGSLAEALGNQVDLLEIAKTRFNSFQRLVYDGWTKGVRPDPVNWSEAVRPVNAGPPPGGIKCQAAIPALEKMYGMTGLSIENARWFLSSNTPLIHLLKAFQVIEDTEQSFARDLHGASSRERREYVACNVFLSKLSAAEHAARIYHLPTAERHYYQNQILEVKQTINSQLASLRHAVSNRCGNISRTYAEKKREIICNLKIVTAGRRRGIDRTEALDRVKRARTAPTRYSIRIAERLSLQRVTKKVIRYYSELIRGGC